MQIIFLFDGLRLHKPLKKVSTKSKHEKRRLGVPRKLDCKLIAARRNSMNSFRAIWVRVCLWMILAAFPRTSDLLASNSAIWPALRKTFVFPICLNHQKSCMTSLVTKILDENVNSHEIKNKADFPFRSHFKSYRNYGETTEWFKIQTLRYTPIS